MQQNHADEIRVHLVRDAVRRRAATILLIALVAVAASAALTLHPSSYVSSAKVLVRPAIGNALSPNSTVNGQQVTVAMETEANLVVSPEVVKRANKELGSSWTTDSAPVTALVPPNTQVVQIDYKATSARDAQQGAQAFADAYLGFRLSQANTTRDNEVASLKKQGASATKALKKSSDLAAQDTAPADAQAQAQLQASRLATIQDSLGQLLATEADPGSVIAPATLPAKPSGIGATLILAAAAAIGLGLGLAVAVYRERGDRRLTAARPGSALGLPVIAALPRERRARPRLIFDRGDDDPLQDAFRRARASIIAVTVRPSVLVLAGVSEHEVADEVAVNLASALASARFRVTLVDASLGHGDVSSLLHVGPRHRPPGRRPSSGVPELVDSHGFKVLPAGASPKTSRDLYASTGFSRLLASLREEADYVLVLGPPASSPDFGAVSMASDGLVVVASDRRTKQDEVEDIAARVSAFNVPLLGVVLGPRRRARQQRSARPAPEATTPEATPAVAVTPDRHDDTIEPRGADQSKATK